MRWIVGDIHGCVHEFERLLREIRFDSVDDELWSTGDLINRGPASVEVLRLWRDLGGRGVLGNHDLYGLGLLEGKPRRSTGDDLGRLLQAPDVGELMGALGELPLLAEVGSDAEDRAVWLVHAGLHPTWADLAEVARRIEGNRRLGTEGSELETRFATRVRYCTVDGKISAVGLDGSPTLPGAQPWDRHYRGEAFVVHGHWAQRGYYRNAATMGLDSGCTYGGGLTAWCLDENRIVRIPSR